MAVDCEKYIPAQQLDVVIVAPSGGAISEEQANRLRGRILNSLGAVPIDPKQPGGDYISKATAFARIKTSELLGRQARSGRVYTVLERIRRDAERRRQSLVKKGAAGARDEAPNTVVFLYFVGRERAAAADEAGRRRFILLTSKAAQAGGVRTSSDDIASDLLRLQMARLHGAHLLFMDVQPVDAQFAVAPWPDDPHLGIFRTVWKPDASPGQPLLLTAFERAAPTKTRILRDLEQRIEEALRIAPNQAFVASVNVNLPTVLGDLPVAAE